MCPLKTAQGTLFELPPARLEPAQVDPTHVALAARLPAEVRLGGMTWSLAGWIGSVYAPGTPEKQLAARGLGAYASHPLLRTVEIDRSYYEPLPVADFQAYLPQV